MQWRCGSCETKSWNKTDTPCKLTGDLLRKNVPCRLRVMFAVKSVKNKFLFVLCLVVPSAPDVVNCEFCLFKPLKKCDS